MSVSYENLWDLLAQKGLKRVDLCKKAGITTNTLAKLGKNESVNVDVLSKICGALDCTFDDIVSNTGENAVINPLPNFNCDSYEVFEYNIANEFETLKIKTLKDLPKPHTVNNIKKTLVKYIKECKLSIESVNALLNELKKYNIFIYIDDSVTPDHHKIPINFSSEDESSEIYQIKQQQLNNYFNWKIKGACLDRFIKETPSDFYISNFDDFDISKMIQVKCVDTKIEYNTAFDKVDNNSTFPFNLFFSIFDNVENGYYFRYQYPYIIEKFNDVLDTITPREKFFIKLVYEYNNSIDDICKAIDNKGKEIIKIVFEQKLQNALRKLRHPSRNKHLKKYICNHSTNAINLKELKWNLSVNFFDFDTLNKLSSLFDFDYLICAYLSENTELNTRLIFLETIHENKTIFQLLSIDAIGNILDVKISDNDKNYLKNNIINFQIIYKNNISIEDMNLTVRSFNCLKNSKINSINDIISKSEIDLMKIQDMGRKSLDEIINKVKEYGYYLNDIGVFEYRGLDKSPISVRLFAKYYLELYSINMIEYERLLTENFIERCTALGYSLSGADWFIEMFSETTQSLNDINFIDKINNGQLLGSLILKKWRHITHWSNESLLSRENRIWFVVAFNRLYQIALNEEKH